MKQIVITKHGGPESLKVENRPDISAGKGELLIRVKASGVNFADIMARQGLYPDAPPPPFVVGYEVSGIVEAVGPGADASLRGKSVFALTRFGGYSDLVSVPSKQVFKMPAGISFEQAATIPVNYLTAYQLLVAMGGLKKSESILIHNAGGGVGLAALEIAKHIGAKTYGTSSAGKHPFLKKKGLNFPIDYRTRDWSTELNNLTQGRGVELIIDPLGGGHWKKSYAALRATGRLGMFGISTAVESKLFGILRLVSTAVSMPSFGPISLMNKNRSVFGVNLGHMWDEQEKVSEWMSAILDGVKKGWIKPHVDKVFRFEEAGKAHLYMEERKNTGKVILIP